MKHRIKELIVLVGLYFLTFVSVSHAQEVSFQQKAEAQSSQLRDGFWIGFGLGGGWSSSKEPFGNFGGRGAGFYFRAGGTVNEHVLFGGEALLWFRAGSGPSRQRGNVTATVLIYPKSDAEYFFKGGFGVASINDLLSQGRRRHDIRSRNPPSHWQERVGYSQRRCLDSIL